MGDGSAEGGQPEGEEREEDAGGREAVGAGNGLGHAARLRILSATD